MKLLTDWGFTPAAWRGQRGEYWVLGQAILLLSFYLLPVYRLERFYPVSGLMLVSVWIGTALFGSVALVFLLKGLIDLGQNLTPLPYPRSSGSLVRSGIYGLVRHPLYSGLIFAALSWSIFQLSASHWLATLVLFGFFNAKASREECWLAEKYPDYGEYRQQVKKLIPWLY